MSDVHGLMSELKLQRDYWNENISEFHGVNSLGFHSERLKPKIHPNL